MNKGAVPMRVIAYYGPGDRMGDLSDLGYWAKTAIDVLVECGVIQNDSPVYIRPFIADCARDKNPRLEIRWGKDA